MKGAACCPNQFSMHHRKPPGSSLLARYACFFFVSSELKATMSHPQLACTQLAGRWVCSALIAAANGSRGYAALLNARPVQDTTRLPPSWRPAPLLHALADKKIHTPIQTTPLSPKQSCPDTHCPPTPPPGTQPCEPHMQARLTQPQPHSPRHTSPLARLPRP